MSTAMPRVAATVMGVSAGLGLCGSAALAQAAYDLTDAKINTIPWQTAIQNDPVTTDYQTGQGECDLAGAPGSTNPLIPSAPVFQWYFDRGSSASTTDGTLFFRARLNGKTNTASWEFSNVLLVGLDFAAGATPSFGTMDLFALTNVNTGSDKSNAITIAPAGTGTNTSPNTTTVGNPITTLTQSNFPRDVAGNSPIYDFRYVTDGRDLGANGAPDAWVSFSVSFASLVSASNTALGLNITDQTATQFAVGTSTQGNAFNEDLGGTAATPGPDTTTWTTIYQNNSQPAGGVTIADLGYKLAAGSAADVDLGAIHMGGDFSSKPLTVTNTTTGALVEYLDASVASSAGNVSRVGLVNDLAKGQSSGGIAVDIPSTTAAGNTSGTVTLNYTSDGSAGGYGLTSVGSQTVNVTGTIYSGQSEWVRPTGGAWSGDLASFPNWDSTVKNLYATDKGGAPGTWAGFAQVDSALFGNKIAASSTVTLGSPVSLKSITFDNNQGNQYTITATGTGSLALASDSGTATLASVHGDHSITVPIALRSDLNVPVSSGKLTVAQLLIPSGVAASSIDLNKTGSGTLVMSGASDYAGATVVNQGKLQLDGSLQSAVDVKNGATLSGSNGVVNGTVSVSGVISPGDQTTASQLTSQAQTWASVGQYDATILSVVPRTAATPATVANISGYGFGTSDLLVTSSLEAVDGFTLNLVGFNGLVAGSPTGWQPQVGTIYEWLLVKSTAGAFASLNTFGINLDNNFGSSSSNFSIFTTQDTSTGDSYMGVRYAYSAVPEATTMVLGMAGIIPVLLQRRSRRSVMGK